jgi:hypothetical protein
VPASPEERAERPPSASTARPRLRKRAALSATLRRLLWSCRGWSKEGPARQRVDFAVPVCASLKRRRPCSVPRLGLPGRRHAELAFTVQPELQLGHLCHELGRSLRDTNERSPPAVAWSARTASASYSRAAPGGTRWPYAWCSACALAACSAAALRTPRLGGAGSSGPPAHVKALPTHTLFSWRSWCSSRLSLSLWACTRVRRSQPRAAVKLPGRKRFACSDSSSSSSLSRGEAALLDGPGTRGTARPPWRAGAAGKIREPLPMDGRSSTEAAQIIFCANGQ